MTTKKTKQTSAEPAPTEVATTPEIIPTHKWTNSDGDVLIVRFVSQDGKSYGDFQHPMKIGESVTAPDWDNKRECGGGIHG